MAGFGNREHAKLAAKKLQDKHSSPVDIFKTYWSWVNGVASGISSFIEGDLTDAVKTILTTLKSMDDAFTKVLHAVERGLAQIYNWVVKHVLSPLQREIVALRRTVRKNEIRDVRRLAVVANALTYLAYRLFNLERKRRIRSERHQWAETLHHIRALHQTIEREAAGAYRASYSDRVSVIQKVLDLVIERDPILKNVVGKVITGLLDFAEIDDPLARWVLNFALKEIIDKLGIDKAVGTLAADLLAPLIGEPKPRTLAQVIGDITQRLDAIEKWQAQFMDDGGAEVEQAGETWKAITSLTADAAILGFAGMAAADPTAWARDINDTIGRVANDTATGIARLIKDA